MDFAFTEEQKMIRETAAQFLLDHSDSAAVRRAMASRSGYDPALWQRICGEMCWSAVHIPERYGGLGLGYVELVAVLEQMGRVLLCAPFFSTVCLAANALLLAGSEEQKEHFLPQIADGSLRATLAWRDAAGDWDASGITLGCAEKRDSYQLNGSCRYVVDGHTAELLIVAARAPGSNGEEGISLFAVPANAAGITRTWLPTMDQTRKLAAIQFDTVEVLSSALLGDAGAAWPALQKTLQLASIALAAELAGATQKTLDMAVAYTRERQQFGRSIASFQAIKHKAADMMVRAEACKSAIYYAACVAEEALNGGALGGELAQAASLAKAYCSDACFHNAGTALQMHGGVGFTWEYDVHLYLKRARAGESFLGDASWHRERIARELEL